MDYDRAKAREVAGIVERGKAEHRLQSRTESLIGSKPKLATSRTSLALGRPGVFDGQMQRVYDDLVSRGMASDQVVPTDSSDDAEMTLILSVVWQTHDVDAGLKRLVCHTLLQDRLKRPAESSSDEEWNAFLAREGAQYAEWRRVFIDGSGRTT